MSDTDDKQDEFGAGVFDDDPVLDATPEDKEEPEEEKITELTDREIAIAEGRDPNEVESKSDDDEAEEEESEEEETEEEDEEPSADEKKGYKWSASDLRLARLHGLTDEEMSGFSSPKALHQVIDLLESRKPKSDDGAGDREGEDGTGSVSGKDAPGTEDAAGSSFSFNAEKLVEKFDAKGEDGEYLYDDTTREFIKSFSDGLTETQKIVNELKDSITKSQEEEATKANHAILHGELDKDGGFYGESMKDGSPVTLSDSHLKLRQEVAEYVETLYAGIVGRGKEPPPLDQLVRQAARAIHGDKLGKATKTKQSGPSRAEKLKKQSRTRRSPGDKAIPGRRPVRSADQFDPSQIANDPEIVQFFEDAQFENGVK